MTLIELQQTLRERVRDIARKVYNIDLDQIAVEIPPRTELGDFAFPVAFETAKRVKQATGAKRNPREIAELFRSELEVIEFVDRVEVAGAGYLNVFIDRARFFLENASAEPLPLLGKSVDAKSPKVCVEHTSVNPNKAAHIGHVRNSVLGDTFVRILRAAGKQVEIQNYIDNTGVQVADVVVGFLYIEMLELEQIRELDRRLADEGRTFDYYCWDLYALVGQRYATDAELMRRRAEVLHALEEGGNAIADLADFIATRNVQCILDTMERLSIRYDLLPRESEILQLHFWQKAFEQMKHLGVVHLETEGKNAGCWVMPFESHAGTDEHEADKILVRSNGTVTYTGKDIAYQMWKLGILGMDFFFKPFHTYGDGKKVWITTADAAQSVPGPDFGHGEKVYNVIDTRQSYPQEIVRKGVAAVYPEKGEQASVHLSYEMVALSPAAAEELGFVVTDGDRSKPFIEMSGRKGLGVKADDLVSRLESNAAREVKSRHPDASADEIRSVAHRLAVGALRYYLLKFTRNTVVVFDFAEALSTEGETGCFCQYSAVRANSIFRKLSERGETVEQASSIISDYKRLSQFFKSEVGDDIWTVLLLSARLQETIEAAAAQNEPAILAKYTFNLAKSFNLFYHNHKIIAEEDAFKRGVLIVVAHRVRAALVAALETLGIEVPERM